MLFFLRPLKKAGQYTSITRYYSISSFIDGERVSLNAPSSTQPDHGRVLDDRFDVQDVVSLARKFRLHRQLHGRRMRRNGPVTNEVGHWTGPPSFPPSASWMMFGLDSRVSTRNISAPSFDGKLERSQTLWKVAGLRNRKRLTICHPVQGSYVTIESVECVDWWLSS